MRRISLEREPLPSDRHRTLSRWGSESTHVVGDRLMPNPIAFGRCPQHPPQFQGREAVHDRPQSLEHFMIIDRPAQLAGKDCAAYVSSTRPTVRWICGGYSVAAAEPATAVGVYSFS